ncbi:MAG: acetyl-CoA carboxylase biotin carboxyl carrier protein [Planctomycetes bacterium]|nr:acetyl-CoA carboxylase biotin carboxyl carrier protein [Planctomycetota bacterium]
MDLKLIQRLIAMMNRGGLAEIDLEDQKDGFKLRLKRAAPEAAPQAPPVVHVVTSGGGPVMSAAPSAAPAAPVTGSPASDAPAKKEPIGTPIPSPMVGTFYRSASPESEPFVSVGKRITVDSVLCIIEAMKVMNEIKSEVSGEIVEILVENGEPVEFGQPLFLVKVN